MFLLLSLACASAADDSSAAAGAGDTADTGDDVATGTAPTITHLDVLWQPFGDEGTVMYADATVTDPEGDLVGGMAKFAVATGSGQPIDFADPILACADVSGACWNDPHLILAIPDVITANDYTVSLVVVDAAGNASAAVEGALEGAG